MKQNWES